MSFFGISPLVISCCFLLKGIVVSLYNAYLANSLNVYDYLAGEHCAQTCVVIGPTQLPTVLLPLDTVSQSHFSLTATQVAWPCAVEHVVITAPTITRELFSVCCDYLAANLQAILPIKQTLNCQSFELFSNSHLELAPLVQLLVQYGGDVNVVSDLPRLDQPGLVVLDMDSTSITIECIDEIAKLAGVGEEVAQITELAMQGELDFAQSLRARVAKLQGIKLSLLDEIADELPLMPGMIELVEQFKAHGWKVAIASGGFTYFADNLKQLLALDDAVSNVLAVEDGVLTGELIGRIVDAQVKADTVVALAAKYNVSLSQTIAIGDGANDLVMMKQAGLGIAYHAKPLVQQQASVAINQGNLCAVIGLLTR